MAQALRLSGLYGLSVHLRTAKQRYSKLANWDYLVSMRHALDNCEESTAPDLEPQLKHDISSSTTNRPIIRTLLCWEEMETYSIIQICTVTTIQQLTIILLHEEHL